MAGRLVTVAKFEQAALAEIARNYLEAQGLFAVVADDHTITMDWGLGNALGGIKVQVEEVDEARARDLLARRPEPELSEAERSEESDAEADRDEPEDRDEPDGREPQSPREEMAARLARGAVLGLVLWPLQFYMLWLLIRYVQMPGEVRPRFAYQAAIGGLIILIFSGYFFLLLRQLIAS